MSRSSTALDRTTRRAGAVLLIGLTGLLVALGVRLVYINASLRPRLVEMAARQQRGRSTVPARRGMVFDTHGRVIALSRLLPDVFVDPSLVHDIDALAGKLAARLNQPSEHLEDRIRQYRPDPSGPARSRFVVLAERVDPITAEAIRAMRSPAVGLVERPHRMYPLGPTAAHVLGFVGRDGAGLEGIEHAYDDHLRGRDGRRTTVRDARRRVLRKSQEATVSPVDGGHVVLTLDAEIQRIAEQALEQAVRQFEADSGVVIVMAPKNGDILAMVSLPTLDPAQAADVPADVRRNRALTDPVEPGSTFKVFIASGAIEGGFVSLTEQIDCRMGLHYFGKRPIRDTKPSGKLDIRGIITRSSNIGMGFIAERMGNSRLRETMVRFGMGAPTGIDLPGEGTGLVHPLHRWTKYSPTSVAMGYEVLVTPIQLITAFAAIVNDGVLLRPRLVSQLLAPDGRVVESHDQPEIVRRVLDSDVARFVAGDLLVSVVENGGGHAAEIGPYRVLGKTGTAKLTYQDQRGYEPDAYLSVFMGAAPANSPEIAALALVRRPNSAIGYYGGKVAAPVVGQILARVLAYMEVEPEPRVALHES